MKTLCIIISLLILSGIAQSQSSQLVQPVYHYHKDTTFDQCDPLGESPLWVIRSLVVWWDEYSAECWADSEIVEWEGSSTPPPSDETWVDSGGVKHRHTGGVYFAHADIHYWSKVTHREPTLDSFMEFLKKKISKR